ncbi:hypothetical protein D039_0394A, partial [Vibrio parahaemolyticus EKP-028]
MGSHLKAAP